MSKIILMRGLPACGKSTISMGMIKSKGNTVRLDLDKVRKMLHFGDMSKNKEKQSARAMKILASDFLKRGTDVIIDGVNLKNETVKYWENFAKKKGIHFEINDMTDVPVDECVSRDNMRMNGVGSVYIKNLAIKYGLKKFEKDSVVICDLDGTISDLSNRLHYIKKPKDSKEDWKKDWKKFFAEMAYDPVITDVQKMLNQFLKEGKIIIFATGRPGMYRDLTLTWLHSNFLSFYYTLIMRKQGDMRKDFLVKKQFIREYFPDKSVIHVVLEDRPAVIEMLRKEKLTVIDCGNRVVGL